MAKAYGLGPAVSGKSVDCPECKRAKGQDCALKGVFGDWYGCAKRCHPARITAAIAARQARERGRACP